MPNDARHLDIMTGPLLLFGGPYSNLQATQAIRRAAETRGVPANHVICTGDIVAYCADPSATIDLIRDWGIHVVQGNCEQSLGAEADDCGCGFVPGTACSRLSAGWYRFANEQISAESRSWLSQLPRRIDLTWQERSIAVVHGGVEVINRFVFPSSDKREKERELDLAKTDVVIGGHAGIPFGQNIAGRTWLNTGAIGMPANDGTRDGWYLLLDVTATGPQSSWHRLAYDAEHAAAAMRLRGLNEGYCNSLLTGLWPSLDVLPVPEREQQGIAISVAPLDF